MPANVTCRRCGLPFELSASASAPVLRCPRCEAEVVNPRRLGRTFEVPFGSIAVGVLVLLILSPCWGLALVLLLRMVTSSVTFAVPLGLGVGGLLLWEMARQTLTRLVPPKWALLADIALAVLLAIAVLLVTAAMCFGPRR